jgi:hypothetical protein
VEGTTPPPNKEEVMTRKDYVMIAGIIKDANYTASKFNDTRGAGMLTHIAIELSDELAKDNPRFDRVRFLDACGVK